MWGDFTKEGRQCKMEIQVLLTNQEADYDRGRHNPFVGTEWQCMGWVYKVSVGNKVYQEEDSDVGWTDFIERQTVCDIISKNTPPAGPVSINVYWENDEENVYVPGDLTIINDDVKRCNSIWN